MNTHQAMRAAKQVSIWIGDFSDEMDLDDYLSEGFAEDFGFEIYPPDAPEAGAESETDIRSLLRGFSSWERFVDAAEELAHRRNIETASCAVVFYNFAYDPELIRTSDGPLRFLGTVPWSTTAT